MAERLADKITRIDPAVFHPILQGRRVSPAVRPVASIDYTSAGKLYADASSGNLRASNRPPSFWGGPASGLGAALFDEESILARKTDLEEYGG